MMTTRSRGRSTAMLAESERGPPAAAAASSNNGDNLDIDFDVTESGRTVAHLILSNDDFDADADGLDFSITSSGRTIEHIIQDQMQTGNLPDNDNNQTQTIVPGVTVTASDPLRLPTTTTRQSSAARAIPQTQQPPSANSSHPGSQDSSGSQFLSGILNMKATTTFGGNNGAQQLSHTPPTAFGTSYENKHFGKRQRSGSVSGRLRSASDLEEKGLIDRQQKGILKDLIICGDEDLQHALDQYEDGNPAVLEDMIRSGALQNKAVPDLDLLGDLDLDFLTVHDTDDHVAVEGMIGDGPGMYSLSQQQQQRLATAPAPAAAAVPSHSGATRRNDYNAQRSASMPSIPVHHQQSHKGNRNAAAPSGLVAPMYDDGIGELEFTGDFTDNGDVPYYGNQTTSDDPHQNQFNVEHHRHGHPGKQHRAPSPPIAEDKRLRSNSLFSALINDPRSTETPVLQYGRWMDHVPRDIMQSDNINNHENGGMATRSGKTDGDATTMTLTASASQPIPIPNAQTEGPTTTPKKKGRRKSDSAAMDKRLKAQLKQELAEQKRREKQQKREQREREKQEKKEARLAAKAEKQKLKEQKKEAAAMAVEEEERPVHVPGSGRPRSMSDPNLRTTRDEFGLVEIERPDGWVGAYSPESRKMRIEKFLAKRNQRVWTKTVKYDVRKNFADSRLRVKGRFVKKEDEMLMRDLMSMT